MQHYQSGRSEEHKTHSKETHGKTEDRYSLIELPFMISSLSHYC